MFEDAEDTENMVCRRVWAGVEIGVYPVLFGFRIRCGYVGSLQCCLDWCCGMSMPSLVAFYIAAEALLTDRMKSHPERIGSLELFFGIPGTSDVKPVYLDQRFVDRIDALLSTCKSTASVTLPSFEEMRQRHADAVRI